MGRSRSKWIKNVKPEHPVTEAARHVLDERLRAVWHYAKLAANRSEKSTEFVHQLRVATRRAHAVFTSFAEVLPKRKAQRMQKMLCRLRRAAGAVRDLDVFRARLVNLGETDGSERLIALAEQIAVRRCKAQKPVTRTFKHIKRKGFKKQSRALIKSIRWEHASPEPTFAVTARCALRSTAKAFFSAGQSDLTDIESLHQLRIAGKQLRYAMELFANVLDDTFRNDLYSAFEEVQQKLGEINDHATAINSIGGWLARESCDDSKSELETIISEEQQALDETSREFREWWTGERVANLEQEFSAAISDSSSVSVNFALGEKPL